MGLHQWWIVLAISSAKETDCNSDFSSIVCTKPSSTGKTAVAMRGLSSLWSIRNPLTDLRDALAMIGLVLKTQY